MYNLQLADRVRELIAETDNKVEEKVMFSGVTFMVNGKMCVSIGKDRIMVRLSPKTWQEQLEQPGCEPMAHGGRSMKGFLYVNEDVVKTQTQLRYWVDLALDFNKVAKSSKKKK